VLAVEDDDLVRDVVATHLRRAGHQVIAASSGQEALEVMVERAAPDVAVVDIGLPDTDGFALVTALRERHENLPVIFLTGRVEMEQVEEGRRVGATYLTKPFIASALLTAIDRAVLDHAW
jgi:DNA-binding response OmpR family regulator